MFSSRMESAIVVLLLIFAVGENVQLVLQKYLQWKFLPMNRNCRYAMYGYYQCMDIRKCHEAKAAVAMGSWPTVCGWVNGSVPRVCCDKPLVYGKKLLEKIDEEKARNRRCGTRSFKWNISETEKKFNEIMKSLPPLNTSDPTMFDPPLEPNAVRMQLATGTAMDGLPSRQGVFPWMVSIRKGGNHWCGGTLIDRSHILSAAHCFTENETTPNPTDYTIYIGNMYYAEGYPIKVKKIAIHPQFNLLYYYHDIAVLTLSEEILSPWIAHICLPSPELAAMDFTGRQTSILGWGRTFIEGNTTLFLHIIDNVSVVPFQQCKASYEKVTVDMLPNGLTEDFICTEIKENVEDACQMDSGGPLMYKNNYNNFPPKHKSIPWVQVGVALVGIMCGEPGFPIIYTKVANYMDWITKIINE